MLPFVTGTTAVMQLYPSLLNHQLSLPLSWPVFETGERKPRTAVAIAQHHKCFPGLPSHNPFVPSLGTDPLSLPTSKSYGTVIVEKMTVTQHTSLFQRETDLDLTAS